MALKKVAFIAGKEGPWVPTQDIPSPRLKVQGLSSGEIRVVQRQGATEVETRVTTNGIHELKVADWSKVHYDGAATQVLCHIMAGRKVAV